MEARLEELFEDRLSFAERHSNWYRTKKRGEQRISFFFRFLGILLFIAGGISPQVAMWASGIIPIQLGYILLALSGGCFLFDRLFSSSANWQRFIIAALEIEAKTELFRLQWNKIATASNSDQEKLENGLDAAYAFTAEIESIILEESKAWSIGISAELTKFGERS